MKFSNSKGTFFFIGNLYKVGWIPSLLEWLPRELSSIQMICLMTFQDPSRHNFITVT